MIEYKVIVIDINDPLYYSKDILPVEKYPKDVSPLSDFEIGKIGETRVLAMPIRVKKEISISQLVPGVTPTPKLLDSMYDE